MQRENNYLSGLSDGIPIGLGYLSVSFTFGIMAVSMGIPIGYTLLISMTNMTSAGQLAGIGVIASGGSFTETAFTQLIINLRYILMSLSLSQKLDDNFNIFHRLLSAFGIADEIFAVVSSKENDISPQYMYGLITIPYIGWTTGTAIGALACELLPKQLCSALGIGLYAMNIAIILSPVRKKPRLLVVIFTAAGLSCLIKFLPALGFISNGFSIIICTIFAATLGAILMPIEAEDNHGH
jgi:predicted branched-subunit amino acid permease